MLKRAIMCIKWPLIDFSIALMCGIALGIWLISPSITDGAGLESINNSRGFLAVFSTNAIVIVTVYISIIFTKFYAYFVYILNGGILGLYTGWILTTDISLLILLIPHGLFEIPCLLATGYVLRKGETFVRKNGNKFWGCLCVHIIAVAICALIEVYATPVMYEMIAK